MEVAWIVLHQNFKKINVYVIQIENALPYDNSNSAGVDFVSKSFSILKSVEIGWNYLT